MVTAASRIRTAEEVNTRPPHLPYVLLCRVSGARCGHILTVNTFEAWRVAVAYRNAHEKECLIDELPSLVLPGDPDYKP